MRNAILYLPLLAAGWVAAMPAGVDAADARRVAALVELARPLEDDASLAPLIKRIGGARYVLLGEASHGTSEFYTWRDRITRLLVAEHGFRFIAVEGDWDACYRINRYVKHLPGAGESARAILESFDRWPQWMWANEEVEALVEWLREFNADRTPEERAGFYGIDLYGLSDSMQRVVAYLRERDREAADRAQAAYACLAAYTDSISQYAWAARTGIADCAEGVEAVLEHLRERAPAYRAEDPKAYFNAKLNALVVRNAEAHYRAAGLPDAISWNRRVDHFLEAIERVSAFKGEAARGVVWAHNTHVGDARATAMRERGSTNIGQLLRQRHGPDQVYAVGFSTHRGRVLAGSAWAEPVQRMAVPPAVPGSAEDLLHRAARAMDMQRFLLLFGPEDREGPLGERLGHRAIGVVYRPADERGNYVPTVLPQRYDALIYIDETRPLKPVHP